MKEIYFINRNAGRWKSFENILEAPQLAEPDQLADLFIQVTDDLSFSRTFFPEGQSAKYLNGLAARLQALIYRSKSVKKGRLKMFFLYDYPLLIAENRKFIYYSLIIFGLSVLIGIISSLNDSNFIRLIMGDSYVNKTLSNMQKGDPLAIYSTMGSFDSWLYIARQNISVSFLAFVLGCFTSFGTAYILLQNGIMLGAFHVFLYQHGYLADSIFTIWIHGTLEIFAIIIAGAGGIVIGNSILFPETYSRLQSFISGVRKGIKIVTGIVPVFIVAAFLEGFVTRHTHMPLWIKLTLIIISLSFIVFYFFIYPHRILLKSKLYGK
jgi:uncharacterized membrane protein SpoIIM required for sporulation